MRGGGGGADRCAGRARWARRSSLAASADFRVDNDYERDYLPLNSGFALAPSLFPSRRARPLRPSVCAVSCSLGLPLSLSLGHLPSGPVSVHPSLAPPVPPLFLLSPFFLFIPPSHFPPLPSSFLLPSYLSLPLFLLPPKPSSLSPPSLHFPLFLPLSLFSPLPPPFISRPFHLPRPCSPPTLPSAWIIKTWRRIRPHETVIGNDWRRWRRRQTRAEFATPEAKRAILYGLRNRGWGGRGRSEQGDGSQGGEKREGNYEGIKEVRKIIKMGAR